jgi:hypothetical protein
MTTMTNQIQNFEIEIKVNDRNHGLDIIFFIQSELKIIRFLLKYIYYTKKKFWVSPSDLPG